MDSERICKGCKRSKPLATDYYLWCKLRGIYDTKCKKCRLDQQAARRVAERAGEPGRIRSNATREPTPADPLNLALREWGVIDRKGQLRPVINVELPEAA